MHIEDNSRQKEPRMIQAQALRREYALVRNNKQDIVIGTE
jgi:hypothetical protein